MRTSGMYTAETNSPTRSHKSPRKTNSPTHSHKSPIKEPRESYLGPTLVVHANLEKKNIQAENYEKSLENTLLLMLEIGRLGRIIEEQRGAKEIQIRVFKEQITFMEGERNMLHTQLNSLSRTGSVDMLREQIGSMEFEKQQMQKRAQEEHESFTTAIKGLRDQIVILQSEKNNNQFGTKEELVRLQNITNVQIDQNKQLQMENQLLKMRITEIQQHKTQIIKTAEEQKSVFSRKITEDVSKYQQDISKYQQDISKYQQTVEAIAQEKNILVRQMSEETMQLQMNIRSLQEHVRGIEHEKQTLIIRMKEESQSYTKQVGTLKEQLQLHQQDRDNVYRKYNEQLQSHRTTICALKEQIANMEIERQNMLRKQAEDKIQFQSRLDECELARNNSIKKQQQEEERHQGQVKALKEQLSHYETEKTGILRRSTVEVEGLGNVMKNLKNQMDNFDVEKQNMITKFNEDIFSYQQTIKGLKEIVRDNQTEKQTLIKKINEESQNFAAALHSFDTERQGLLRKMRDDEERNNNIQRELKNQLGIVQAERQSLVKKALAQQERNFKIIQALKDRQVAFEQEYFQVTRRLREAELKLQEKNRTEYTQQIIVDKTKLQASKMELNLKYSQQSENLSRSLLREKTNEVEELKQRIKNHQNVQLELKELRMQNSNYSKTIQKLSKQITLKTEQLSMQQGGVHSFEVANHQLQTQLSEKIMYIQSIETTLSVLKNQKQNYQHNIELAEQEIRRQEVALQNYQLDIRQLRIAMDDCQRIMVSKETQLAETIDQLTRRIKELETIIKGLEKENRSIRTDLTRSNRQAHSTQQNTFSKSRLSTSNVDLKELVSSVVQLKKSNERSSNLIDSKSGTSFAKVTAVRQVYYGN